MAEILVLGAGLNGLSTAMLLARDGHQVTVLERDLAPPPEAGPEQAWEGWERRGVSQFRLPHVMLPRWRELMERELPEVLDEVLGAGGPRLNLLAMLPEPRRFDEVTVAAVEPLYRATLWFDRGRLAELAADAAGDGGGGGDGGGSGREGGRGPAGDPRWAAGKALFAASLADQDVAREYLAVSMLLTTAEEVFTRPGMAERVMRLGAGAARYPLPGPDRHELLAAIGA